MTVCSTPHTTSLHTSAVKDCMDMSDRNLALNFPKNSGICHSLCSNKKHSHLLTYMSLDQGRDCNHRE